MAPEIDPLKFRSVLGHYPTGVTVVTGMTDDGPAGLAIGSFTSVSLDPPLVSICPSRSSTSWARIEASGRFCVNVLAADQESACRIFASRDDVKFASIDWSTSPLGSPILEGVTGWVDCEIHAVHEAGDHTIVVGLVHALDNVSSQLPLVFYRGRYGTFDGGELRHVG